LRHKIPEHHVSPPSLKVLFWREMDRWVSTKIQWLCDIEYSEGHSTKNDLSMEVLRDFCTR
jgi:hypothetical protein